MYFAAIRAVFLRMPLASNALISLAFSHLTEVGTPYAMSNTSESNVYQEKIMTATLHTAGHLHTAGLPVVDFTHLEEAALEAAAILKNVALFAAAPFIGLVYAVALPFVGLAMLAWMGVRAYAKNTAARAAVKNVVLFVAAPLIGLVYAMAMPLVVIALIAKTGYEAYKAPAVAA